jgi:hypothetical protein
MENADKQLEWWAGFYQKVFGINLDTSIEIPKHVKGFDRLVVVAQDVNPLEIWRRMERLHMTATVGAMPDLEAESVRGTGEAYAIWVSDWKNDNREYKLKTVVTEDNGITLEERLLLGMMCFLQTGEHLDNQFGRSTFCTGSSCCGGSPVVDGNWAGVSVECSKKVNSFMYSRRVIV